MLVRIDLNKMAAKIVPHDFFSVSMKIDWPGAKNFDETVTIVTYIFN